MKNTREAIEVYLMALKREGAACADDLLDLIKAHEDELENQKEYSDYLIALGRLNDKEDEVISVDQMRALLDLLG